MATEQDFKSYCAKHGLTFIAKDLLDQLFGAEEWDEDVVMAGFYDDPSYGAAGALLRRDGTVEVCTAFADGIRRMEDVWMQVTDEEFNAERCHAV